jgi:protein O-GlcNAc transferase
MQSALLLIWRNLTVKCGRNGANLLNDAYLQKKMISNETIQLALRHYHSGDLRQAEHFCKIALDEQPYNSEILYFLGIIYAQLEDHDSAIQYIKMSLNTNAENADAYLALGMALGEKGLFDEAIAAYQKAIEITPENAGIYHHLGMSFQAKGELDEAVRSYKKALDINPRLPGTYNNLGMILQEKRDYDGALECYRKAVTIAPHLAEAQYNLGNLLHRDGKQNEALAAYDKAIEINPDYLIARWGRCIAQLQIIYPDQSDIEISRRRYEEDLLRLRKTIVLDTPEDSKIAPETVGVHQPFYLAYQGLNDRELQQIYGDLVCRIMAFRYTEFAECPSVPRLDSGEPIRIGMVSGYFRNHSIWKLYRGWVENIDKQRFKLLGYHTGKTKDSETKKARECFSQFVEDIYSFEELCRIIRRDNLHVLIYPEIGMDSTTLRLAAMRLAPVQCVSWGHPDTSGLPTIDYFLSSDLMEPVDAGSHYTEKLVRLPNLSIYYAPLDFSHADINREIFNLRQKSVLYLCCQSLYKYLPQYDEIYPRIARQLDDCQFLFISNPSRNVTEQFRFRIKNAFSRYEMNADNYVIFLPQLDAANYHVINCISDIYLDSIGWSGGNTTLEAIAADLPVVTIPGTLMRGRHSTAMFKMMGMTETIAATPDEYIEIAVRLGLDTQWRNQISGKIARNKYLLYRDKTCITALEDFFEKSVKERLKQVMDPITME